MLNFGDSSSVLRKRPGGQILDALDWAMNDGPAKWCDDITYSADETLTQLFITANVFTVNITKTLTMTQLRPLVVIAHNVIVNGTIEASGKGCSAPVASGNRYTGIDWPFEALAGEAVAQTRNYCLCGAGGGSGFAGVGGGAYAAGGAVGSAGGACGLTDAKIKELLFSPLFNIFQIGLGGSGSKNSGTGGAGGGSILLIAKTITVGSAGSVLANGIDGGDDAAFGGGGGGGGFVGLIADNLSVHGSATIEANGGAKGEDTTDNSADGGVGGAGVAVQIEV